MHSTHLRTPLPVDRPVGAPAISPVFTRPLAGPPLRSAWGLPAAVGALTEAIVHIPVIEEHLTEAPYIGVAFIMLTVAGFLLAHLLLEADSRAVWASTAVVSALALAAYVLSRTVGLPQIGDDIGHWADPLGTAAIAGEALMLLAALAHFPAWRRSRPE